jgi:hypothetical protein
MTLALAVLACALGMSRSFSAAGFGAGAPAGAVRSAAGGQGWADVPAPVRIATLRALGGSTEAFAIERTTGGLLARSVGGLASRFSAAGADVSVGSTRLVRLRLLGIGRGPGLSAVEAVAPSLRRGLVRYSRDGVGESYASGAAGLEQTFIVGRRLAGRRPLTLAVGVLAPRIRARPLPGGLGLSLGNRADAALARYGGLRVTDASGHLVPSRVVVGGRRILLVIDDRGARYPLRVDPWVQVATVSKSGGVGATSVAATPDGHVVTVGSGSEVYVFTEPAGGWKNVSHPTATLRNPGPLSSLTDLGDSVAISANGDTIVAGAPGTDDFISTGGPVALGSPDGLAYVYKKPSNGWQHASGKPTAQLTPNDATRDDQGFGSAVAMDAAGNKIVVGDPEWNDQGALYMFTEPSGGWHNISEDRSANVGEPGYSPPFAVGCAELCSGEFGSTISMSASGDNIVTAAPAQNNFEGAVYVFYGGSRYNIGGYVQLADPFSGATSAACSGPDVEPPHNPIFGSSVGISSDGGTIVAGLPCDRNGGEVAVYDKPAGGWSQANSYFAAHGPFTAALGPTPPYRANNQEFGSDAVISGDASTIVADDPSYPAAGGFLTTFSHFPHGWAGNARPQDFDSFFTRSPVYGGMALTSDGSTIFVGGTGPLNAQGEGPGVLYVFAQRSPGHTPTSLKCASTVHVGAYSRCNVTVENKNGGTRTPTGTVAFSTNAGSSGHLNHKHCTLSAEHGHPGKAQCSVRFYPQKAGGYLITAKYGGDNFHASGTATATITTPKTVTVRHVTSIVGGCQGAITIGTTTKCVAVVSGSGSDPAQIQFTTTGASIGGEICAPGSDTQKCTVSVTPTTAGTLSIEATYPGNSSDKKSVTSFTLVVNLAPTSTGLVCSPLSLATGQTVTCTATTTQITGPQTPPLIQFYAAVTGSPAAPLIPTCATSGGGATETCTAGVNFTTTGSATILADFPGDADAAASSRDATVSVQNPTTTTVACTATGTGYSCTATVVDTGADPTTPTGSITWSASKPGTFANAGTCTLAASGGNGVCATTFTPTAMKPTPVIIFGTYSGDVGHTGGSGAS